MRNFILGIILTIVVLALGVTSFFLGRQTAPVVKCVSDSPYSVSATPPGISPTVNLVGNDKDEHGCIGSAGYSWCEAKKKCLRLWEEGCEVKNDNDLVKQAMLNKYGKDASTMTVTVKTNDGTYASGSVNSDGGGGYFFAAKSNGQWVIVADGNGVIECSSLAQFPNYPTNLIPECFDNTTGQVVQR